MDIISSIVRGPVFSTGFCALEPLFWNAEKGFLPLPEDAVQPTDATRIAAISNRKTVLFLKEVILG